VRGTAAATYLLLDLERPPLAPRAAVRPRSTRRFRPADPVGLLPPDSRALLPTRHPTPVMIGVCSCGEPGCGSLWMQVRRDGDEVVWGPTQHPPRGSVRRPWRFGLVPYLDAIDAAAGPWSWEGPSRLLARELRTHRDGPLGPHIGTGFGLHEVRAWPGVDRMVGLVAGPAGLATFSITVRPGDTLDGAAGRIRAGYGDGPQAVRPDSTVMVTPVRRG
jgi:hypothetical protein